jgi:hypothetical protein
LLFFAFVGTFLFVAKIRPPKFIVRPSWAGIFLAFGAATLVGGGWYLRNFICGGSPIYPAAINIFGRVLFPGQAIEEMIALEVSVPQVIVSWPSQLRFVYTWYLGALSYPGSWVGFDARLSGLGTMWSFICMPAIMYGITKARVTTSSRRGCYLSMLTLILIAFISQPNNWWARYTCWLYVAGISSVAVILSSIRTKLRTKVLLIAMICAIADSAPSFYYALTFRGIPAGQNIDISINRGGEALPLFPEMSSQMPNALNIAEKIILGQLSGDNTQLLGNLLVPLGKRNIASVPALPTDDELDYLVSVGYRDMIWDKHWPVPQNVMERFEVCAEISRFYHLAAEGFK